MTRTTVIRPSDPTLRPALRLALLFAAIKLVFHIASALWQTHIGYGYFRDEFYYLICGRHLAWGYVDQGPLVAVQARVAETLFGRSLVGIRLLSALGGAIRVALTGLICWALGGRRSAQALAMLFVLTAPIYLGIDSILSMNSWESAFWMPCILAVILILRGRSPRLWWTVFGVSAGLGLLNKPSMTFFLIALAVALLLTPQRRVLFTRYTAWAIALLVLIALPNLFWQMHHNWATLEFLHNGRIHGKNTRLGPLPFIANQILVLGTVGAFVWIPGLVRLLRQREQRWLGFTYCIFLVVMIALGAKDYYAAPIYPFLFAAGGVAWQQRFASNPRVQADRAIAWPILTIVVILLTAVLVPATNPVLRPATFLRYARAIHLPNTDSENEKRAVLPQLYADRFGWQEEVNQITAAVQQLSPQDRAQAGIIADNYGEAGALDFLGHNLPPVVSGHNNYWLWGPHNVGAKVLLVISGDPPQHFQKLCQRVQIVGNMNNPLAMPFERLKKIYLLHDCLESQSPRRNWAKYKFYY
jgi:4-amino-4-deoxy-L-arabinose transferase-like glycosyltransferase